MRILQANKFHFVKGGAERYYLDVSRRLEARGHTVIPFAMRHARNEASDFERYFVSEVDYHGRMSLGQKLRAAARSIYSRRTVRQIEELIERERPEVAHLHNIYHQISPSLITALHRARIPVVLTLHDYKVVCPGYLFHTQGRVCEACKGRRFYNAVRYRCLLDSTAASVVGCVEAYLHSWLKTWEKVACFHCPSRFMLEKVAEHGIRREKLVHLPYLLPLESYRPSYRGSDYFIYLGRLSREKGVATLLAAQKLRKVGRLTCRILGEGPLEEKLKAEAVGNVEFSGYLQGEALHAAIRDAALTVVPSEWFENFPFSIGESFALGTPVIGARIGGIPELVRHEETGMTFTPGDAADLATALDAMESRPERMIAMGRAARKLAEETYEPEAHIDRLEELYARVIQ